MAGHGTLAGRDGAFGGRGALGRLAGGRRVPVLPAAPPLIPLDANLVTIGDSLTAAAFVQNDPNDRSYAGSGFITWFSPARPIAFGSGRPATSR